jgi:hypothetical protein
VRSSFHAAEMYVVTAKKGGQRSTSAKMGDDLQVTF